MESNSIQEESRPLWKPVNELCEIILEKPNTFDKEVHLLLAEEIIESLDGVLYPSRYSFAEITTMDKNGYESKVTLGEHVCKVGNYVVYKRNVFPKKCDLLFDYFWSRDQDYVFEKKSPSAFIQYNRENHEVVCIGKMTYKIKVIHFLWFAFETYGMNREYAWQK